MKRHFLIIGFMLCRVCVLMFGEPYDALHKIQQTGVFTVALCGRDTVPMFYQDTNGNLVGHEIELASAIAHELGTDVCFVRSAKTFDDVISLVADGKADAGISMLSATVNRARNVRFTDPYLLLYPVLIENRMAAESHARIVYASEEKGTSYSQIAKQLYPDVYVYETSSWNEAFSNTINAISQITIRDEIGTYIAVSKNKGILLQLKVTVLHEPVDYISIAVNRDNAFFAEWLNVFLRENGYPKKAKDILTAYELKTKEVSNEKDTFRKARK